MTFFKIPPKVAKYLYVFLLENLSPFKSSPIWSHCLVSFAFENKSNNLSSFSHLFLSTFNLYVCHSTNNKPRALFFFLCLYQVTVQIFSVVGMLVVAQWKERLLLILKMLGSNVLFKFALFHLFLVFSNNITISTKIYVKNDLSV